MPDRCRSCNAEIVWARTPPTERNPEGANVPVCRALVYWPANEISIPKHRDDLPDHVKVAIASKPSPAYDMTSRGGINYLAKIGDFYIVRDEALLNDWRETSRQWVSHYATCPQAGEWSRRGKTREEA